MSDRAVPSRVALRQRPLLRGLSSPWVGLGLLGAIVVYLSVVSIGGSASWDGQLPPLQRWLDRDEAGLYALWPHWLLWAALLGNLALATVVRIPLRASTLGAWLAHAGVLVLAGGSALYVSGHVHGDTLVDRVGEAFAPVGSFYQAGPAGRVLVVTVVPPDTDAVDLAEVPLPGLPLHRAGAGLDRPVAAGGGVSVRVTGYRPVASVVRAWRDDGPADRPAVELEAALGPRIERFILPADGRVSLLGVPLAYRPDLSAEGVEALSTGEETLLVTSSPGGPIELHWLGGQGPRGRFRLLADTPVELFRLPEPDGGPLRLTLRRVLRRAHRVGVLGEAPTDAPPGPALAVEVRSDAGGAETWLPLEPFGHLAEPAGVTLGDGMRVWLAFTRRRLALPAELHVHRLTRHTYPGTVIARDYRSAGEVVWPDGRAEPFTIGLNEPLTLGDWQLSQGRWDAENPDDPAYTILAVTNRPGLGLVWTGAGLILLGLMWAFYLKPRLRRREEDQS